MPYTPISRTISPSSNSAWKAALLVAALSNSAKTKLPSLGTTRMALPSSARKVSSNPGSYVYLAESIREWPDHKGLALRMVEAGWGKVDWHNLSAGIVALHHSVKPS